MVDTPQITGNNRRIQPANWRMVAPFRTDFWQNQKRLVRHNRHMKQRRGVCQLKRGHARFPDRVRRFTLGRNFAQPVTSDIADTHANLWQPRQIRRRGIAPVNLERVAKDDGGAGPEPDAGGGFFKFNAVELIGVNVAARARISFQISLMTETMAGWWVTRKGV